MHAGATDHTQAVDVALWKYMYRRSSHAGPFYPTHFKASADAYVHMVLSITQQDFTADNALDIYRCLIQYFS